MGWALLGLYGSRHVSVSVPVPVYLVLCEKGPRCLGRCDTLCAPCQVGKLRAEVTTLSAALKENRTAQLESRLNTLADSLVEKQGLVDQLISEKVWWSGSG